MKFVYILFFLTINQVTYSQNNDFDNFTGLRSEGKIPKHFLLLTKDKVGNDIKNNKNNSLDDEFFLATNYFIDELLLSGNVLFNDKLTNYVIDVAEYILSNDSVLFNSLNFYVLKSNAVNAFSTDQGFIFITTGLLSQLENEAQLAFILSHEIAHYTESHVKNGYIEQKEFTNKNGRYRDLSYDTKVSKLSMYSKNNEFSADKIGFMTYLKSEYDISEVKNSFDVLLYSSLPFEDKVFDVSFFNKGNLKIPKELFKTSSNKIKISEDFDDKNSSHPNIKKRKENIEIRYGNSKSQGNLKFKISEETFYLVRDLSRFESVNIYLANRDYVKVIYNIFLLSENFKNNNFLEFSFAKALYGLAKYKNHNRFNEVILKPKNTEGQIHSLALFISKISKEEINTIAYRHLYALSQKNPNNNLINKYERDMLKELALFSGVKPNKYLNISHKEYVESFSITNIENDTLNEKEILLKKNYYLVGLAGVNNFDQIISDIELFIENKKDTVIEFKQSMNLNISNVVVVDPYLADYNIKRKKKNVDSEKLKVKLSKMYLKKYNKLDISTQLVDSKTLTENDVDKYNEIGILYQWLNEVLLHDDIEMISSLNNKVVVLKNKYDTEYFLFSAFLKYKQRHQINGIHGIMAGFIYPIPLVIIDLLIVHNYVDMVGVVINSNTDQIEFIQVQNISLKGNKHVINGYVYELLYNLSQNNEK